MGFPFRLLVRLSRHCCSRVSELEGKDAAIGANLLGALVGEQWKGRGMDESLQVGWAAFWGRLLGTIGKLLCGTLMIVVILAALVV